MFFIATNLLNVELENSSIIDNSVKNPKEIAARYVSDK